jgi:hypothetical protein
MLSSLDDGSFESVSAATNRILASSEAITIPDIAIGNCPWLRTSVSSVAKSMIQKSVSADSQFIKKESQLHKRNIDRLNRAVDASSKDIEKIERQSKLLKANSKQEAIVSAANIYSVGAQSIVAERREEHVFAINTYDETVKRIVLASRMDNEKIWLDSESELAQRVYKALSLCENNDVTEEILREVKKQFASKVAEIVKNHSQRTSALIKNLNQTLSAELKTVSLKIKTANEKYKNSSELEKDEFMENVKRVKSKKAEATD